MHWKYLIPLCMLIAHASIGMATTPPPAAPALGTGDTGDSAPGNTQLMGMTSSGMEGTADAPPPTKLEKKAIADGFVWGYAGSKLVQRFGPLARTGAAWGIGNLGYTLASGELKKNPKKAILESALSGAGAVGGEVIGRAAGAAIGTAILPGVGSFVGSMAGGMLGQVVGDKLSKLFGK